MAAILAAVAAAAAADTEIKVVTEIPWEVGTWAAAVAAEVVEDIKAANSRFRSHW